MMLVQILFLAKIVGAEVSPFSLLESSCTFLINLHKCSGAEEWVLFYEKIEMKITINKTFCKEIEKKKRDNDRRMGFIL